MPNILLLQEQCGLFIFLMVDWGIRITLDKATLEKLPEIGPIKAQAIIDGRPYKFVEDVMRVSGIKDKTFAAIKDYITVK